MSPKGSTKVRRLDNETWTRRSVSLLLVGISLFSVPGFVSSYVTDFMSTLQLGTGSSRTLFTRCRLSLIWRSTGDLPCPPVRSERLRLRFSFSKTDLDGSCK